MRLDLGDLSLRSGERHECSYPLELAPIVLGGAEYQIVLPDGIEIAVDRVTGGYLVNASAKAKVYGPCARCLTEVALEVHAEEQEFAPSTGGRWDESDLSPFIDDLVVDVESLGREAIILALPDQVLCSPSCKGLCPKCGQDLNQGTCECDTLEISEPMG